MLAEESPGRLWGWCLLRGLSETLPGPPPRPFSRRLGWYHGTKGTWAVLPLVPLMLTSPPRVSALPLLTDAW